MKTLYPNGDIFQEWNKDGLRFRLTQWIPDRPKAAEWFILSAKAENSTNEFDDIEFHVEVKDGDSRAAIISRSTALFELIAAHNITKAWSGRNVFHPFMFRAWAFTKPERPYEFTKEDWEDFARDEFRHLTAIRNA